MNMKFVEISIPYPPSINKIYYNRKSRRAPLKGRGLTLDAKNYKRLVADLIYYSFPHIKYGKDEVKVSIISNPPHHRGDSHNGIKIVFDALQLSGIINNDKQIVAHELIPGHIKEIPSWDIKIVSYAEENKISDLRKYEDIGKSMKGKSDNG